MDTVLDMSGRSKKFRTQKKCVIPSEHGADVVTVIATFVIVKSGAPTER